MARTYACQRKQCGTEFKVGAFAALFTSTKYCRRCRKGALITPADHLSSDGTGEFTAAPWTDLVSVFRPAMFGQHALSPAKIAARAALLAPTAEEAEDARRAAVLRMVAAPGTTVMTVTTEVRAEDLTKPRVPAPAIGGGWADIDLAEVIEGEVA